MIAHPRQRFFDAVDSNNGVGIENQGEFALCHIDALVVGLGKTGIGLVFDKLHIGEAGLDEGHGIVGRIVIDHDNLAVDAVKCLLCGSDGLLQEVLDAVTHYDY